MLPYNLLTLSFLVATTTHTSFAFALPSVSSLNNRNNDGGTGSIDLLEVGIKELEALLGNGTVTSVQLVEAYLANIQRNNHDGLLLRAVIETAPYDSILSIASSLDDERSSGNARGPLHGIPILLKDNIATDVELGMNTTAGSYALLGMPVLRDSFVAAKLRAAGAIIIGKANLSEFANWKGRIHNGWSARGGQTQSAYVVGGFDAGGDPCGSSAGSAVGVSAGFAASSLGSETDGSIICPSNRAALFGLKPSVGLVSRAGVVPISSTQDTTGPMAKSVYDVAVLLETIAGFDERDEATSEAIEYIKTNYTQYVSSSHADFSKFKLGVPRDVFFNETLSGNDPALNSAVEAALVTISSLGAQIQDPADLPSAPELVTSNNETIVLRYDFKIDIETYLRGLGGDPDEGVRTLEDIINFNDRNRDLEFTTENCCQETLVASLVTTGRNSSTYISARAADYDIGATRGIDAALDRYGLDALILPSEGYATSPAAIVGYPIGTVPLGYLSSGQPFGLAIIVRKWNEAKLLSIMAAFESAFPKRQVPSQLR